MDNAECECRKCLVRKGTIGSSGIIFGRMILCSKCGNKRCPHATDHEYECTNSNEPGQKESVY